MEDKRCELCLSVDIQGNNYKNVTCKITRSIIDDISKVNHDCPLKKQEDLHHVK
jgi:hypothetical protein